MPQAVKVGIFGLVALVVAAVLILRIEDWNPFAEGATRIDAEFESVAGLDDKSAVRVAGVRVGRVDGIVLDGRRARVTLLLEQPVALTEGALARIANMGMLGDKYVELELGRPGAPPLPPGSVLPGETPIGFDQAMAKLNEIGDSIQRVTGSLTGEQGTGTPLARLLDNLEATTAEIRGLVAMNRQQISATVANFESFSGTLARELPGLAARLDALLAEVQTVVAENRGNLAGSLANIQQVTDEMKVSVANLNAITTKIASGEGTIGKLVASDEAHDELVSTLKSIEGGVGTLTDTLGRAQKLKLDLGLETFYLTDREDSLGTFSLDLSPGAASNKLYRVGLVSTPAGETREKTQRVTVTNPDGSIETTTVETFTQEDSEVVTALLGLKLKSDARLWGGLIEDAFGVQAEVPLWQRRVWVDLKAFDFDREGDRDPHLRLTGRYYFSPNLFLVGGYDDPLESDFDSLFLGGGLTWTDDDLKYLLGTVGTGALK